MATEPSLLGHRVGNFTLTRVIGDGAMGIVYLAEHDRIERKKAVKVLRREWSNNADLVRRFFTEAMAASACEHEHIIAVDDCGTFPHRAGPHHFMLMEYLDGRDVATVRARLGRLPPRRAAHIAVQAADALAAAHRRGIVHRDLKPQNLFLTRRGGRPDFVKLLDFGIARLTGDLAPGTRTRTGQVIGTPEYMSPEQARGLHPDARSDVWSLGVVLYEMLTGRLPFLAETFTLLAACITREEPPPVAALCPDVPAGLARAVARAMAKSPDDRYPSMRALQRALVEADAFPDLAGEIGPDEPVVEDTSSSQDETATAPGELHQPSAPTILPQPAVHPHLWIVGAAACLGAAGAAAWLLLR